VLDATRAATDAPIDELGIYHPIEVEGKDRSPSTPTRFAAGSIRVPKPTDTVRGLLNRKNFSL
jgi:ribosomal protein S16